MITDINIPATILIVDDTPANLQLLTRLLGQHGYKTRPITDSTKAFALACKTPPDLILLDVMMPDMDGYQVCQQLKADERTRDIPVIFLSALSELNNKVKGFASGGVDYITKPFQSEEILARVQTHLMLRQTQQQLQRAMKQVEILYHNLQGQLALAQDTQSSLLPAPHPTWLGLELICYNSPAYEIGGDFYNYHAFRHNSTSDNPRYALAIGDISGKGVSAALLMAASLSQLDASFAHELTLRERVAYLDKTISSYAQPRKQNCALIYLEVELQAQPGESIAMLQAINAGCIPPYIKRLTGEVEHPDIGGFPLGQNLTDLTPPQAIELRLHQGDFIILTSDGVVEAKNQRQELLGFDRLEAAIQAAPTTSAAAILEHLKLTLMIFTDGAEQHDDITILVARV